MYWKCPVSIGNVLLEKSIKDFLNLLDWHTASAVKDTFIISDIQKNKYKKTSPGRKKKLTLQNSVRILKKNRNKNPS